MIYFTADLHFHHLNAIRHSDRPFASADEMNEALIENWNRRVTQEDDIYVLGDVTMKGAAYAEEVLRRLNGRKYLIRGNHDRFVDKPGFDHALFEWVKDYHEMNYAGCWFVLFHYPIEEWNQCFRGAIHLHGHQHNGRSYNEKNRVAGLLRYDVGVDANDYMPVSIDEIIYWLGLV